MNPCIDINFRHCLFTPWSNLQSHPSLANASTNCALYFVKYNLLTSLLFNGTQSQLNRYCQNQLCLFIDQPHMHLLIFPLNQCISHIFIYHRLWNQKVVHSSTSLPLLDLVRFFINTCFFYAGLLRDTWMNYEVGNVKLQLNSIVWSYHKKVTTLL